MIIKYKDKLTGNAQPFVYGVTGIPSFCAGAHLYNFRGEIMSSESDAYKALPAVDIKDIYAEILKDFARAGMLFLADQRGGWADTFIFPYAQELVVTSRNTGRKYNCVPMLSPYYINGNSGNEVRHLTIHMSSV